MDIPISDPYTILSILIAAMALLLAYNRYYIANQTLKITKNNNKPHFKVYLEAANRTQIGNNNILLFNIEIKNLSGVSNTFKAYLEIDYQNSDRENHTVILNHDSKILGTLTTNSISVLEENVQINSNSIKSGWIIFKQPILLIDNKILRYRISIKDIRSNQKNIDVFLIKTIEL